MKIILGTDSEKPIYLQVADQIRAAIVSGSLADGERLPSVRQLAEELHVSVITTKRAYDELRQSGLVTTVPAKGTFVAVRDQERIREEYLKEIEGHMRSILLLARFCDLSDEELGCMYQILKEGA